MTYTVFDIVLYVLVTGGIAFFVGRAWPGAPKVLGQVRPRAATLGEATYERRALAPGANGSLLAGTAPRPGGDTSATRPQAARPAPEQELVKMRRRTGRLIEALRERGAALRRSERTIAELRQRIAALEHCARSSQLTQEVPPQSAPPPPENLLAQPPADADDLTRIRGIGRQLARRLNALGIYRYVQIASLRGEDILWLEGRMQAFRHRIGRDRWVEQAAELARMSADD